MTASLEQQRAAPPPVVTRPEIELFDGNKEREPLPKYPILILGAGQGTGAEIAKRFAREGYPLILGTRSKEKFTRLREVIVRNGGLEPQPFIADITETAEIRKAYLSLQKEGTPLHYFPLAAGGLEATGRQVLDTIARMRIKLRKGTLTREDLENATAYFAELNATKSALKAAEDINLYGILEVMNALIENGNITPTSSILTLSSSLSHDADPDHPENYPGPEFYRLVALTKETGVRAVRKKAAIQGAAHVDLVAPEISGTDVGNLFEKTIPLLQHFLPTTLGSVTMDQVANAAYAELRERQEPRQRTVFVTETGTSDKRPQWSIGTPYL